MHPHAAKEQITLLGMGCAMVRPGSSAAAIAATSYSPQPPPPTCRVAQDPGFGPGTTCITTCREEGLSMRLYYTHQEVALAAQGEGHRAGAGGRQEEQRA
eukprot:1147900-Pelagomonas_calceolata.AAC.7